MLRVASVEEARAVLLEKCGGCSVGEESVPLANAAGRVLARPVLSEEDIPGFDRATVDGFAVRASDTFGSSASIPALLQRVGEVAMGKLFARTCRHGECAAIPTGGPLPPGTDAVVMVERTEDYGEGLVGVTAPVAPGENVIYRDDDVAGGEMVFPAGKRLGPADIGVLAALGVADVAVARHPKVGILSTGDEVVPVEAAPVQGEVRDVNAMLLSSCVKRTGGRPCRYGIAPDDDAVLRDRMSEMAETCDVLFLSGGSSVGAKDGLRRAVESLGEVYLHGIAVKPGKPTLFGAVRGKPLIGFPGHPAAVYFIYDLFGDALLRRLMGEHITLPRPCYHAVLSEAISSNHGRQEYVAVALTEGEQGLTAKPLMSKSGLITTFSRAEGYIEVPRDAEGLSKGDKVRVTPL